MRNRKTKEGSARDPKRKVFELALLQHGAVHLRQALEVGMSRGRIYRLLDSGEWTRPLPRVLTTRLTGDRWLQQISAACLWGGTGAAASHQSAGALWEMDGIDEGIVEITITETNKSPRDWLTVRHSSAFAIHRRRGLPVTTVPRTLIDLGAVVDSARVERALEDVLRRRLTTLHRVQDALGREGGRGRRGAATLARIIHQRGTRRVTDSEFERRLLGILKAAGFPPPVCQHAVHIGDARIARLDFAYPAAMIGIEADSYRWHSGREAWSHDRTRSNALVGLGWRILHATWADIEAGGTILIRALRTMLGQQTL